MFSATLTLYGQIRLFTAAGEDITPRSKKLMCLIAFLALQRRGESSRDRLAGLLWSDRGEEHARASLRQTLIELRELFSFAPGLLRTNRDSVGLNLDGISVDAVRIEALLKDNDHHAIAEVAGLWQGELLAGVVPPDPAFDEWLTIERAERVRVTSRAVRNALEEAKRRGMEGDIVSLAETLLRQDPTDEQACQTLIEIDLKHGNTSAALRRFATFRDFLAREFQLKVSSDLERLISRVRHNANTSDADLRRSTLQYPVRRRPYLSVAIRPPIGPPEYTSPILDILQEELFLCLGRSRSFVLIANSVADENPLLVDYALLVRTHVRECGGRVTFRLTLPRQQQQIWVDGITLIGNAPSSSLVTELERIAVATEHAINLAYLTHGDEISDPYGVWLAGDRLTDSFDAADLEAAIPLFRRAAEMDPHFARPVASLSSVELTRPMASPCGATLSEETEHALALANKAVAIDPWDARNHTVLAWAYLRKGLPMFARAAFERALSLNSQDPAVLIASAEGYADLGEADRGIKLGEMAFRMHPAAPGYYHHYMSIAYGLAGAYERALEHSQLASITLPEQLAWRALVQAKLGIAEPARQSIREFVDRTHRQWRDSAQFHPHAAISWLDNVTLIRDQKQREDFFEQIKFQVNAAFGKVI
jgi:DNA-binding SARP family transcriptional activator